MAVLKDLIVHGSSRFLGKIYTSFLKTEDIEADKGKFNRLLVEDVTATNATVLGLMDVKGELHTNTWTNSNIATIDGSFYITPTIGLPDGAASVSANSISFAGTSYSLDSIYTNEASTSTTSTVSWTVGSKILVTGEVEVNGEWMPFGTLTGLLGTVSSTSVVVNTLKANRPATVSSNPETLAAIISAAAEAGVSTSSLPYRNVKISMYQTNRSNNGTTFYPLGIYMSALGANGRTFIDIYGGNNAVSTTYTSAMALPVVRVGNLSSMNLPQVGGITPNGWGIYTSNGFFSGTVAAKQGKIGDGTAIWTIGSDGNNRSYIYSGINNITNSGTTKGIYVGTNGISNYENSTQYVNLTGGKITAQGADIQGVLKADTGRIGGSSGWTIASQQISSGTLGSDNSMFLSTKNLSGTVSGKTFDSSNPAWRLTVGSNFGITNTGSLYASEAVISGAVTANSLNVGSVSDPNHLIYNSSTGVIDLSTDWLRFDSILNGVTIGDTNSANAYIDPDTFNVTNEYGAEFFAVDMDGEQERIKYSKNVSGIIEVSSEASMTISDSPDFDFIAEGVAVFVGIALMGGGFTDTAGWGAVKGTAKTETVTSQAGTVFTLTYDGEHTFTVTWNNTVRRSGLLRLDESPTLPTPSLTFGTRLDTKGSFSSTFGEGLSASHDNQVVIGRYNEDSPNAAFIIGNGVSDPNISSNALTVDWNGVTSYYGDVTNLALVVSVALPSITYATNSNASITGLHFTKKGNLGMLHFTIKSTGAIGGGSNIFQATLAAKYRPAQYTTGVGYYGNHPIIGRMTADGAVLVRNVSTSNVTLTDSVEVAFTYILKDYFV